MRKVLFIIYSAGIVLFSSCSVNQENNKSSETDTVIIHSHNTLEEPDSALAELISGNLRYVDAKPIAYKTLSVGRDNSAKKQAPYAVILCCSDSRVPPEEIFDVGIGEIFVVRSAGEVVDSIGLGSIEYAVEHLGTKLIVVLGHERCGAVTATVNGGEVPGHIASIVDQIKPALELCKNKHGDKIENAVRANVDFIVKKLSSSKPVLKELLNKEELEIVGAYYDLDDGTVEIL